MPATSRGRKHTSLRHQPIAFWLQQNRGASILEFSLILPLVFIGLLGAFDLGRYILATLFLEAAANRGIAVATTIPGLDEDEGTPELRFEQAKDIVIARTQQIATLFIISAPAAEEMMAHLDGAPELDVPSGDGSESRRQKLQSNPMTLTVRARMRFFLPLIPDVDLVAEAKAYRETRSGVALVIPVDCSGRPLGGNSINMVADTYSYAKCDVCDWSANQWWDRTSRSCKPCNGAYQSLNYNSTGCSCTYDKCKEQKGGYASMSGTYATGCNCTCNASGGMKEVDGKCGCQDPTKEIQYLSSRGYSCLCTGENKYDVARCKSEYGANNIYPQWDNCSCYCYNNDGDCQYGNPGSPATGCICTCPAANHVERKNAQGKVVGCDCSNKDDPCPPNYYRNPYTCQCACDRGTKCTGGINNSTWFDTSTCSCSCYTTGDHADTSTNKCSDYETGSTPGGGQGT